MTKPKKRWQKDVCVRGHAMIGDNIRVNAKTGARRCRACVREAQRERYENEYRSLAPRC